MVLNKSTENFLRIGILLRAEPQQKKIWYHAGYLYKIFLQFLKFAKKFFLI